MLTATFPAADTEFRASAFLGCQRREGEGERREREGEKEKERESERKSHCLVLWDNQFAVPLFVPVLLSVSHTVSTALHP